MGRTLEEKAIDFGRYYSKEGVHPFDEVDYSTRDLKIQDAKKGVVFHEPQAVFPTSWSDNAALIVADKYFKAMGPGRGRETDVRQLVTRVARTIRHAGITQGVLQDETANVFEAELTSLLINQMASFNSPVWFNLGLHDQYGVSCPAKLEEPFYGWNPSTGAIEPVPDTYARPQISACFIDELEDSIASVMDEAKREAMLFKYGSGTGMNISTLRGKREPLSGGGYSSGSVGFAHVGACVGGIIKSGGKTRRAAKMLIMNVDHPDIVEFIDWKCEEEKKLAALGALGYDTSFEGDAYNSMCGQNANMSVRVTDEFMQAVQSGNSWNTVRRTDGSVHSTLQAKELFERMARAAWNSGDPGIQFDTTINAWHTCPVTDRIHASNPCSEYMFLNNSSCNLASLNLLRFKKDDGSFDVFGYKHAVRVMTTAMEILVDHASYPGEKIARNSHDFRPLGLGYANLGSLLMSYGLPYNSDEGRALCGALTAILSGEGYAQSSRIAGRVGAFAGYELNREPFLKVVRKHRGAVDTIPIPATVRGLDDLVSEARMSWDSALFLGERYGFRNAQISVLAPTGTIGFMMDCDTTGIEPEIALVKWKTLSGGGSMKLMNSGVDGALRTLGYSPEESKQIRDYISVHGHVEGAPFLRVEHVPVFDCSFTSGTGTRSIHHLGHIRMMAAAQPFISGAISKTVNMPRYSTIEDVADAYTQAWNLGLKALAIYRDGSKVTQVLNTSKASASRNSWGVHRPLPQHFFGNTATTTFRVNGIEGKLTVYEYDSGRPGKLDVEMFTTGSTFGSILDDWAKTASLWLQYGVPLEEFVHANLGHSYAPSGLVEHPHIKSCTSIPDLVTKFLAIHYLGMLNLAQVKPSEGELRHPHPDLSVMNEEWGERRRLPKRRVRLGEKVGIEGEGVHISIGEYPDGSPGEIFVDIAKAGENIRGVFNSWAIAQSHLLQRGFSLEDFVAFNKNISVEPCGRTDHQFVHHCSSVQDLVARIMDVEYLGRAENADGKVNVHELRISELQRHTTFEELYRLLNKGKFNGASNGNGSGRLRMEKNGGTGGKPCSCGGTMRKLGGNCYKCTACGGEDGGCGG